MVSIVFSHQTLVSLFITSSLLFLLLISISTTHLQIRVEAAARPNLKSIAFSKRSVDEEEKAILQKIGSRPPRCDKRRCNSCGHCEAIQVPTNPQVNKKHTTTIHPSYAYPASGDDDHSSNYKPMSWKCKCGNYIFNP